MEETFGKYLFGGGVGGGVVAQARDVASHDEALTEADKLGTRDFHNRKVAPLTRIRK
jgi:hypothetical protein